MTGPAWFLLPVLTPILVMLAALVLQRFEAIVMNQVDPAPPQESLVTDPSVPEYRFGSVAVTPAEKTAAVPSRQLSAARAPVTAMADAVHVNVKIPSTEAIPSPRAPLISAVDDTAAGWA